MEKLLRINTVLALIWAFLSIFKLVAKNLFENNLPLSIVYFALCVVLFSLTVPVFILIMRENKKSNLPKR